MKHCKHIIFGFFLIFLSWGCRDSIHGTLLYSEPDVEKGFHWPYYLYIPDDLDAAARQILLVEPNNSGFANNDLEPHRDKAERIATRDYYLGNFTARALKIPLLVPVFPRSEDQWRVYTHALDRDVMLQKGTDLERIDLQLIKMVDHAREKLHQRGIETNKKIFMTGFSASGTFTNRFALLHPDKLLGVAAGGLNGLLMLPADSLEHQALIYPLGTADKMLFDGNIFMEKEFQMLPQYYFMGQNDENDAIPYEDAFDQPERDIIYSIIGQQMQPLRWQFCCDFYRSHGVNADFKTYPDTGHEHPDLVKADVVLFFKNIQDQF